MEFETATVPLAQQQAHALLNVKDLRVTLEYPWTATSRRSMI
ncbi:hypothetical protein ACNKHN_07020 [Shigella flexneri]